MRDYNSVSMDSGGIGRFPQAAHSDTAAAISAPVQLHTRASVTFAKALALQDIKAKDILARYGTWVVTTYGVECLSNFYPIEKGRLFRNDGSRPWPEHMAEKRWIVQADFLAAYADAVQRFADA